MARQHRIPWLLPILATAVCGSNKANSVDASVGTPQSSDSSRVRAPLAPLVRTEKAAECYFHVRTLRSVSWTFYSLRLPVILSIVTTEHHSTGFFRQKSLFKEGLLLQNLLLFQNGNSRTPYRRHLGYRYGSTLTLRMPSSTYTSDRKKKNRNIRRNTPSDANSGPTTAVTPSVRYVTRVDRRDPKHPMCYFTALPCQYKQKQRRKRSNGCLKTICCIVLSIMCLLFVISLWRMG